MDSKTIFTKTAKGLGETVGKTKALSRGLRKVLKEVDGQAPFAELETRLDMAEDKLQKALEELLNGDYIREFRASETDTVSADDLDFTTKAMFPETLAQLTIGAYLRAVAEAPTDDGNTKSKAKVRAKDREGPATVRARWQRDAARYNEETVERAKPPEPAPVVDEKNEHVRRMEEAARQAEKEIQQREAELKARREAEAKARKEAEEKARIEAEERARQEAELKARREAEIQARREAEEKARAEAQAKARREAEERARKAAEEKARMEAEAKRAAEEKARREAEEQARREAEEKVRKLVEEKARREAEEAARKEAEERARREAEEKARKLAEEKARQEAEAAARKEAEERARREAEEKAKREAEEKARREAEARAREEQERARREAEERERKEAEERAAREAKERAEREAEAARLAEEQARLAAELKKEQEERARREAELQKQKELRELEARVEAERKRLEAEKAAREDAEARARLEEEQRKLRREEEKAAREAEALARKQAKEEARRQAEEEAERAAQERAKRKAEEQEQRAREQEAKRAEKEQARLQKELERHAKEQEREAEKQHRAVEREPIRLTAYMPSINFRALKIAIAVAFIGAVAGVALVVPALSFDGRADLFEKTVSAQFHQPVKIGSVHFALLPRPHWRIEDITIGDRAQIKAKEVAVNQPFGDWFNENPVIESVEISSPVLNDESMGWLLFGKPPAGTLHLGHVTATNAKWEPGRIGDFDVEAQTGSDGAWKDITFFASGRQTQLELHPEGGAIKMEMNAGNFPMPFGAQFSLASLHALGVLYPDHLDISEFRGYVYDGSVEGNAKLDWSSGWSLQGRMQAKGLNAALFAPGIFASGSTQGDAKFVMRSEQSDQLFSAPRAEGNFAITSGAITGIDLGDLFKGALKGGRSAFSEFSGSFTSADGKAQLRGMHLKGGLMSAAGYANVSADNNLDGHFIVDLNSQVMREHADLAVSGTVKAPRFAR